MEITRLIVQFPVRHCRFKGSYCGQDVAIKVLNSENLTDELLREFDQEVYVMK